MTRDTEVTLIRNRQLLAEDRFGRMATPTPEGIARSQEMALRSTLKPQTIGRVLGSQVATAEEERFPAGVPLKSVHGIRRETNIDARVTENAGSTPLGITDLKSGFDIIIPGTPHTDPDGDMMS